MPAIRGGMGLGDAIYLQSVARHLVESGVQDLEVCTAWPDVFRPLYGRVRLSQFRRNNIDYLAHYSRRRTEPGSSQFDDMCIEAGIKPPVDLRLDWSPLNFKLINKLIGADRPVIVVQMPRAPFGRPDGFGQEFLPDCRKIQRAIDHIGKRATFVQIGNGEPAFRFTGIDWDLRDKTSVTDVIDIGYAADGFLGYCSFIVPLSESFNKPELLIWSRRGLRSSHMIVRAMTPQKILHRPSSKFVIDDCPEQDLQKAADALCEQAGSAKAFSRQVGGDCRKRAGVR